MVVAATQEGRKAEKAGIQGSKAGRQKSTVASVLPPALLPSISALLPFCLSALPG
jgi:hypothetical protein